MHETYSCYKYSKFYIGKKGKFVKGQLVNVLYIDPEDPNRRIFMQNVEISNNTWEDPLLRSDHEQISEKKFRTNNPIEYYFVNPGGSIQCFRVTEDRVFDINDLMPRTLYA